MVAHPGSRNQRFGLAARALAGEGHRLQSPIARLSMDGGRHRLGSFGNKARSPQLPLHEVARRHRCGPPALPCGVCRVGFRFRVGSGFGRSERRRCSNHGPNGFVACPPLPRRPGYVRLSRSTRPKAAGAPIRANGDKRVRLSEQVAQEQKTSSQSQRRDQISRSKTGLLPSQLADYQGADDLDRG